MNKQSQIIRRTSKPPSKIELEKMKESVITLSAMDNQPSKEKDKPMTKEKNKVDDTDEPKKPRKRLTPEQVAKMIKEWDDKSISELAKEFNVSYQTVSKMAELIRKEDASLCPKKEAVKVKREDIAKAGIALFKKEQVKK